MKEKEDTWLCVCRPMRRTTKDNDMTESRDEPLDYLSMGIDALSGSIFWVMT